MPSFKCKLNPKIQFKVSRIQLFHALRRLKKPSELKYTQGKFPSCNNNIIKQLNTMVYGQPIEWRQNWLEMFQTSITHHNWETFIKALRLASQSNTFCGLDNLLRNSFLSMLSHEMYKDLKMLRLYLYTIAPCRNEQDIEFCIETALRTLNGEHHKSVVKRCEQSTTDATM